MVLVFKTSVNSSELVGMITKELNTSLQGAKWNFDLDDCDNVLRIEGGNCLPETIIRLLVKKGFTCEEL